LIANATADVRLALRVGEQQDRDAVGDEVQGREIFDQLLVDRRLEGEIDRLNLIFCLLCSSLFLM
jgi:hypothetical protein